MLQADNRQKNRRINVTENNLLANEAIEVKRG